MAQQPGPSVRLHASDNLVIARRDLPAGTELPGEGVTCRQDIPARHKISVKPIAKGQPAIKYNQIIGFAQADIAPGDHVHSHNMAIGAFDRDYAVGADAKATEFVPEADRAVFEGYVRPNGKVGTRNYLAVQSSVNCSASVVHWIAEQARKELLPKFPHIDDIVPITHDTGCGMPVDGAGYKVLQRALAGYAKHPNFAATLIVGLGCEGNQISYLLDNYSMIPGPDLQAFNIQDLGGTEATIAKGVETLAQMAERADQARRQTVSADKLILGLECGGSDAFSGLTANPALGAAADLMVAHGGAAVLAETPEIYGAEHLLTRRAASDEAAQKLIAKIKWWEDYAAKNQAQIDNNPSPGNKAGGLTTILEKSLGAVAKGGSTNLIDVYDYAAPIDKTGFLFMDTPGYDTVSITGMVAGGAQVVCFTTGCGTVVGGKPAPVIKLATNTPMYSRMDKDMDINCGLIADGEKTIDQVGQEVFRMILDVASGKKSKSEAYGFGDHEFHPWHLGAVM